MNGKRPWPRGALRRAAGLTFVLGSIVAGAASAALGTCGPFTDVTDAFFCPYVMEIFTLGITTGTTPTTYAPASPVTRLQMAAFLSRTVDGAIERGCRRAPLGQFWTPGGTWWAGSGWTGVGNEPRFLESDGSDVWVASLGNNQVSRVRASDGKLLGTWTPAFGATGILVAMGRVFVGANTGVPGGSIYMIDPRQPGVVLWAVEGALGGQPLQMAFDGERIWTANYGPPASVSIVTPGASLPFTTTTITAGFSGPVGALYDGSNVWVTDSSAGTLLKLNGPGGILQTVTVEQSPAYPAFDGANIWVPNLDSNSVSVVRASNGSVLRTLTGNGLASPVSASFDGERLMVANAADSVSLWKAADLTPLGWYSTGAGTSPFAICSDGTYFFISLGGTSGITRF